MLKKREPTIFAKRVSARPSAAGDIQYSRTGRGPASRSVGEESMNISQILENHMLMNSLAAWAAAQILKTIINAYTTHQLDWRRLVGDGGMPSGHSATVTALATTAALEYGLSSGLFAIAAILAIVVMHDAMGVRREAGKHAKVLNELVDLMNSDLSSDDKMKEFLGHTPMQVYLGALLGFGIALLIG